MTRIALFISVLAALALGFPSLAAAAPANPKRMLLGAHADPSTMPKSCRACHRGMVMALDGEEGICLDCHGDSTAREAMIARGYLNPGGGKRLADIGAELGKPYSHPVLSVSGAHRQYEVLPEEAISAPRHSECVDCHNPHVVEEGKPFRGLSGRRVVNRVANIEKEYELCYRCHSTSANLPAGFTDKSAEFRTTNVSFHPVEAEGKKAHVISLKSPYVARSENPGDVSIITCSDCHGSNDPGGPRGPHGSIYRGLLVANYEMDDERPESEANYALCYKCHDRTSILRNESFPYHSLHIEGGSVVSGSGTSCFTCHDAHGSNRYPNLIRFNEDVVSPNALGKLEYKQYGVATRHGSCTLNCHGVEHSPREY